MGEEHLCMMADRFYGKFRHTFPKLIKCIERLDLNGKPLPTFRDSTLRVI